MEAWAADKPNHFLPIEPSTTPKNIFPYITRWVRGRYAHERLQTRHFVHPFFKFRRFTYI